MLRRRKGVDSPSGAPDADFSPLGPIPATRPTRGRSVVRSVRSPPCPSTVVTRAWRPGRGAACPLRCVKRICFGDALAHWARCHVTDLPMASRGVTSETATPAIFENKCSADRQASSPIWHFVDGGSVNKDRLPTRLLCLRSKELDEDQGS